MPKYIWILVIATAINVTGGSFLWPLNTIYMHNELGTSLTFAGIVLMFNQGFAILGNLVGGYLFDKIGGYKTLLFGTSSAIVFTITLAFHHSIVPYIILLILIGFSSGVIGPSMFAMAASLWPEGGRRAFNAVYVAQNLGVALGTALGGFIASYSFDYIFIGNASVFFIFFIVVVFAFKPMDKLANAQSYTTVIDQGKKIANKASLYSLIILSIGFLVCWIAYSQWQGTISSYTQDLGMEVSQYSLLWTINGLLIILAQPIVKFVGNKIPSTKTQIYIGNTIFLISFVYLLFANTFIDFVIAMTILTIGEVLVWPAVPSLANDLAPKGKTGFYQGIINSVGAAGRMTGPVLGGLVVDYSNIHVLFGILIVLYFIPYVTTYSYDRKLIQQQKQTEEVSMS
ncbi:MDR family MFS transporter [Salirhabdus sp. Marseille-P4669]|uniref:MDR family MFS transporter n=1 Tax=Salirhabdus sp. Marseille-P4669 TaxID=2042310 RepID=UPI000C7A6486|nr:MFS transporter [Salirhabdus sp. Marseille-P4669]